MPSGVKGKISVRATVERVALMAVVCSFAQYMATLTETLLMQIITAASV
jgi:hypothetical protein